MSNSRTHKTLISTIVAVALFVCSGCGDQENDAAPVLSAPTTSAPTETPTSEPTPAAEGTDLAPVDLELDDGGFASSTPKEFHVPSGFLVLITAKNVSDARIRLSISAPSLAQTFKIAPGMTERITLASIGEGERAKMISGGKTIYIAADAEPGP
jgi:glucose/arabinose dehydrogenase